MVMIQRFSNCTWDFCVRARVCACDNGSHYCVHFLTHGSIHPHSLADNKAYSIFIFPQLLCYALPAFLGLSPKNLLEAFHPPFSRDKQHTLSVAQFKTCSPESRRGKKRARSKRLTGVFIHSHTTSSCSLVRNTNSKRAQITTRSFPLHCS